VPPLKTPPQSERIPHLKEKEFSRFVTNWSNSGRKRKIPYKLRSKSLITKRWVPTTNPKQIAVGLYKANYKRSFKEKKHHS